MTALRLFETGKSHAAAGRLQQALQSFQAAAALPPASIELLVEYGYALKDARRLPEARQVFLQALQIEDRNVRVLNGLWLTWVASRRHSSNTMQRLRRRPLSL
jgi:Flp pilus assembly protein TadD